MTTKMIDNDHGDQADKNDDLTKTSTSSSEDPRTQNPEFSPKLHKYPHDQQRQDQYPQQTMGNTVLSTSVVLEISKNGLRFLARPVLFATAA